MATTKVDTDLDFSGVGKIVRALMNPLASDPGAPVIGEVWYNTTDSRLKVQTSGGTVSLATTGDTGSGVPSSTWDAQSFVKAVADDTPIVQVVGPSEVVGRRAAGDFGIISYANLLADLEALGITADTLGTSSEAAVLSRANHTGTQLSSTISDFNTAADARAQAIVDAVVDAAPGTLDTLNELAAALGDDPNFATTMTNALATKTEKFAANIGNGALQTFTVNHNLGSTDVVVTVRENAGGGLVETQVTITDANNVQIDTNSVPTADQYRVVVIG